MIVYAISDIHGQLPAIPRDAELLLLAGDICPDFRVGSTPRYGSVESASAQSTWLNHEFRVWLDSSPCPVVAIWGNHDFVGEHPGLVPKLPWTLLSDSEAVVSGLRIYGTPWVPGLPRWAFYGDERALRFRAEAIPYAVDVLMSHGPPYGHGDFIPTSEKQREKYGNFLGEHVGDKALLDVLPDASPAVTICGHIHEARGTHYTDYGNTIYNVSAVDERYKLHENPFVRLYEFA